MTNDHKQDAIKLARECGVEHSPETAETADRWHFDTDEVIDFYTRAYEAGKADANALPDLPDKLCWSLSGPFKGEAGPVYRFCHDNFTGGNVNQGCGYGPTLYEAALEAIKQIKGEG